MFDAAVHDLELKKSNGVPMSNSTPTWPPAERATVKSTVDPRE